jgi:hypothetical protein
MGLPAPPERDPGKGWYVILRLYSPLQPFFDRTWRPGKVKVVSRQTGHNMGAAELCDLLKSNALRPEAM